MRYGAKQDTDSTRSVRHVWLMWTTHHEDCRTTRPLSFLVIAGDAGVQQVAAEGTADYVVSLHCVAQRIRDFQRVQMAHAGKHIRCATGAQTVRALTE